MDPYVGEIRIVTQNFAPRGWALCNGQVLNVNAYQALFSILGGVYGGNGNTTFALPNLGGKLVIGMAPTYALGSTGGNATNTLTLENLPTHSHLMTVSSQVGNTVSPTNGFFANAGPGDNEYGSIAPSMTLSTQAVSSAGGSAALPNMQPYLTLSFVIALMGIYPTKNY